MRAAIKLYQSRINEKCNQSNLSKMQKVNSYCRSSIPDYPELGKPYYIAHSSLDSLAIMNTPAKQEEWDEGSSVLRWWAWSRRIRTFSNWFFEIELRLGSLALHRQKDKELLWVRRSPVTASAEISSFANPRSVLNCLSHFARDIFLTKYTTYPVSESPITSSI